MGYSAAGFDVVGIDVKRQRRYPFPHFVGDAVRALWDNPSVKRFDVIHASPPCQTYSITQHTHGAQHADLVDDTRDALIALGLPYVIENVEGAPLIDPLTLCGTEFNLTTTDVDGEWLYLRRHRLFESNVPLVNNGGCECIRYERDSRYRCAGVYGGGSADKVHAQFVRKGGYTPGKEVQQRLMQIDWMTRYGLNQALPPVYTEHVGRQLLNAL